METPAQKSARKHAQETEYIRKYEELDEISDTDLDPPSAARGSQVRCPASAPTVPEIRSEKESIACACACACVQYLCVCVCVRARVCVVWLDTRDRCGGLPRARGQGRRISRDAHKAALARCGTHLPHPPPHPLTHTCPDPFPEG